MKKYEVVAELRS